MYYISTGIIYIVIEGAAPPAGLHACMQRPLLLSSLSLYIDAWANYASLPVHNLAFNFPSAFGSGTWPCNRLLFTSLTWHGVRTEAVMASTLGLGHYATGHNRRWRYNLFYLYLTSLRRVNIDVGEKTFLSLRSNPMNFGLQIFYLNHLANKQSVGDECNLRIWSNVMWPNGIRWSSFTVFTHGGTQSTM